jgi:hypothetical protein
MQNKYPAALVNDNLKTVLKDRKGLLRLFEKAFESLPKMKYFRWFGCGDIINFDMFCVILLIAVKYPETKFWCPTQTNCQDLGMAKKYFGNLIFRKSTSNIGDESDEEYGSMVLLPEQKTPKGYFRCKGECDGCRKCWSNKVNHVAYPFHGDATLMAKFNCARKVHGF